MRIAVLDKVHEIIASEFITAGWICDFLYDDDRETLKEKIAAYDGIILRSRIRLDADFLRCATRLKFIGRPGAGLENIDRSYCAINGVQVFRSPEGNCDAVAEHVIMSLLALFNNLLKADPEVRNNIWLREENRGLELKGKTLGIIGYGVMGKCLAEKIKSLGVKVIAYDKYVSGFSSDVVSEVSLEELLSEAEIISLHTPETTETINMINRDFFARCNKNIFFVNTARGKSVVTDDLVDALKSGKVKGACLDVLEYESSSFMHLENKPEALSFLCNSGKCILTPHIAGWTHEAKFKMGSILSKKIIAHFS